MTDIEAQLARANREIRELRAAKERLSEFIIQIEADRARNSNETPADMLALKDAAHLAGCEVEWARRKAVDERKVIFERDHATANIRVSFSSLVRVVRERLGLRRVGPSGISGDASQ